MMDVLTDIFTLATDLVESMSGLASESPLTYPLLFVMTVLDVLLPVIPAEGTVTAAAALAGQGWLDITAVMVAAGLGAFLGDNIAYWTGRAAGRPLVERILRGNAGQLDALQAQFHRRGGMFVVVGRFVPGGRSAVVISAGVLHFSWPTFVVYDAMAAVIWSIQAALPGFIGGSLVSDRPWLAMVFGFVLSALLVTSIALIQRWRISRRAAGLPVRPAVIGMATGRAAMEMHGRDDVSERATPS